MPGQQRHHCHAAGRTSRRSHGDTLLRRRNQLVVVQIDRQIGRVIALRRRVQAGYGAQPIADP